MPKLSPALIAFSFAGLVAVALAAVFFIGHARSHKPPVQTESGTKPVVERTPTGIREDDRLDQLIREVRALREGMHVLERRVNSLQNERLGALPKDRDAKGKLKDSNAVCPTCAIEFYFEPSVGEMAQSVRLQRCPNCGEVYQQLIFLNAHRSKHGKPVVESPLLKELENMLKEPKPQNP